MMSQRTVYIVDDNAEFLESTAWMLEGEGYQVEPFSDPSDCLQQLDRQERLNETCMLMDVRMPAMSGLDLHDRLNDSGIQVPIIYMTGHGDIALAVEAMKKGAVTFLEKPLDDVALSTALEAAFERASSLANHPAEDRQAQNDYLARLNTLTPREKDILDGVVSGKLNKVIAYDLGISIKTVELHRSRVMSKMQASNAAELVKMVLTGAVH
jgi:two-component system response regulator FixJ